MSDAKILLLDIETAPNLGYVWGKWEQNVIDVERHWYILCFAVKWLGQKKTTTHALPDYSIYKHDKEDDTQLVAELWEYFDAADIIVAHNGDRFDLVKSNSRFIVHGMTPPSLYQSVDTLKLARTYFKFDSNRLNDLAKYLGLGEKLPTTGAHLWLGCMRGDAKAWKLMRRYNAHDVELLEQVYLRIRAWSKRHPNLTHFSRREINCPVCNSGDTFRTGYHYLRCSKKQRRTCKDCGHRYTLGKAIPL